MIFRFYLIASSLTLLVSGALELHVAFRKLMHRPIAATCRENASLAEHVSRYVNKSHAMFDF